MPPTVAEVHAVINRLWPEQAAEDWDRVGLVSGDPRRPVQRMLLAVDAVRDTVDEAVSLGADILLTHHPLLLRGVTSIAEDRYKGALLADLIRDNCALIAAHTNADSPADGVSDRIAQLLGLTEVQPLVPSNVSAGDGAGIGRVGVLPEATSLGEFARAVAKVLPATASGIRVSGEFAQPIRSVSLCGGAGDSLLQNPLVLGSDVYVTSDLRHHPASESREQSRAEGGPALIDVSHWASEWLWLDGAAEQLRRQLPGVEVVVSELRTDVWDFTIVQ
nr:Nif3-like dinuclear metal center hexameric protein [Lysinibacter cavernae]